MQGDGDVDHRKSQRSALQMLAGARLDRRDELARHGAADDLVLELEALAARERADLDLDVAELAVPARLLLMAAVRVGALADRLPVGRARRVRLDLDIVLVLQPVEGDAQMDLALTPQQGLVGLALVLRPAAPGPRR